jgi:indole-3-glycerol phosphate synthase / phosphoribosylanthranilate isomerase
MPPILLSDIVGNKRDTLSRLKESKPLSLWEDQVKPLVEPRFEQVLRTATSQDIRLILEIKPMSPSGGILAPELNLDKVLENYNRFGSAISVLTDEKYFGGSFDLLKEVARRSTHPILCKDFVIDPYQVFQARLAGAHAVLLIVKILDDRELSYLHGQVELLGMTAVVEVQNEEELERAMRINPSVILINNRDLESYTINFDTTKRLVPRMSKSSVCISASGIHARKDIEELLPYTSCFLIGSALMQNDPENLDEKLEELLGL